MKTILVFVLSLAVFSATLLVEPTIAPIVSGDPSMSSAAACDEFHGDFNCACWQSVFNPCCPWWEPQKCPPPINQRKKDVARAAANYFTEAEGFFIIIAVPTCATGLILPCVTAGASGFYANRLAVEQNKIVADPPDPLYMYPYELVIPTAESLGMAYTGDADADADYLIYIATIISGYGDFIWNSSNRVTSCQQVGDPCKDWQQARVDEGLRQFGIWIYNANGLLHTIANRLESESADWPIPDIVSVLHDMADVSAWAGEEYWQ